MKALVRLTADVTTKAHATRKRFTRRLVDNLRSALKANGLEADIRWNLARIYLEYDDPRTLAVARRVFGIHSVSPCREERIQNLDDLLRIGVDAARERVRGRRFAVRARVRDGTVGFGSRDVEQQLGAALVAFGTVDLDHPEVTLRVEVRNGTAWFFDQALPGEGGLPVGTGGRAVVLLSGGFDSAVAAYLTMRRGVMPVFLCFRLGGDLHERSAVAVANHLALQWCPGLHPELVVVPFEETVERLQRDVTPRYWQLVLKRAMYRTAELVAYRTHSDALITGEALGQVSSQTLPNLRALDTPAHVPVLRPLLTQDKERIIDLSRHIGTHDLSAGVPEYCGLGGAKPATSARPKQLAEAEEQLHFDEHAMLDQGQWHTLPMGDVAGESVEIDRLPEGATVLDLRTPPARKKHTISGAQPIDPLDVLEHPDRLDATAPYVVVCDYGARSVWFVRRLRELGFQAWSLTHSS
jgi:thiamine biosynthesis protein ThiI